MNHRSKRPVPSHTPEDENGLTTNRRRFCRDLATAGIAFPLLSARNSGGVSLASLEAGGLASDEEYWSSVRREFLLEDGLVYFNNASIGVPSKLVVETVSRGYRQFAANPSRAKADLYALLDEQVRPGVARLVGASPDEIAFTRGASEALYLGTNGIPLAPGDEVLTTSQEHSAGLTPWLVRAERSGIVVKELEVPSPFESASQVVEIFERAVTNRTKVISFCHITRSGWLFPVRELCELAHGKDLVTLVDGAQAVGMFPSNLHDLGCDVYACSLHKWVLGPSGSGMLYVRKRMQPRFQSLFIPGTLKVLDANRYEMIGTTDLPVRVAIGSAIEVIDHVGIQNIGSRNRSLSTYLRNQLSHFPQIRVLSTVTCNASSPGITLFEVKGQSARALQTTIAKRFRIHVDEHVGDGHDAMRVSTHFYNNRGEIDRLIAALAQVMAKG